jgi:hypothetical protein
MRPTAIRRTNRQGDLLFVIDPRPTNARCIADVDDKV